MNTSSAAAFNTRLESRLESLAPTFVKIAKLTRGTLSEFDVEDIVQAMNAGLIRQCHIKPSFIDQKDAYWFQKAKWIAQSMTADGRRYTRYVDAEIITHGDDGDELSNFDFLASSDQGDMEERIIQADAFERVARLLTPRELTVVKMLYQGYSQDEIAKKMGVVKATISIWKQAIAEKMAGALDVAAACKTPRPQAQATVAAPAPTPTPTPTKTEEPARRTRAKLTAGQVQAIRAEYQPRKVTQAMLAAQYGVSRSTIGRITRRETWKNI